MSQKYAEDLLLAAYMAEVEYRQTAFVDDSRTRNNIAKVASHLVNPKKFGLMLAGTCGNGKTTLMNAIQSATSWLSKNKLFGKDEFGDYIKMCITIVPAKDIIARCKDFHDMESLKKTPYLGIDDMGTEPIEVMDYGNICNPVIDLIDYRYNRQLTTFVTTNKTPNELRDRYGVRIADRFREMIEQVVFEDGSYRK